MLTDQEILKKYIHANGAVELRNVLEDLLEKSKKNSSDRREHYIYYYVGEQQSLIKADFSEEPIMFCYLDLLGRPATRIVKQTIADFLWEKCGEREKVLAESSVESEYVRR